MGRPIVEGSGHGWGSTPFRSCQLDESGVDIEESPSGLLRISACSCQAVISLVSHYRFWIWISRSHFELRVVVDLNTNLSYGHKGNLILIWDPKSGW